MGRNILKSSVEDASFSIVFQILFRCITFILNAFIIRHVGQDILGIMNVRLLLLESTILFLSKEPIFKACLTDTKSHNWAQVVNQVWISVPLSALLGYGLVYVWLNVLSLPDERYMSQYQIGCYTMALSCILEQMAQIVVLVAQSYCFTKLKVVFDTIHIVVRTTVFVVFVLKNPEHAIHAFSLAQIVSVGIYVMLHYGFFAWYMRKLNNVKKKSDDMNSNQMFKDMHDFPFKSVYDFLPGHMENSDVPLNKDLCMLAVSFSKQCVIKQILTEGERYVMTIFPILTFSQQSTYDIVNNLGSLAARFVFRPIETSAYFYFTQMIKRDVPVNNQNQKNITEATAVLNQLCKVVVSIGLAVVTFGQAYSYTLLYLYGGTALTDNELPTTLLKFHCFAIVLLAVNGITEGFVFATMSNNQLDRYNYIMVVFSITFLIISYLFTSFLGPVGFIIANCVNMSARIIHSIYYIRNMYKDSVYKPLEGLKPGIMFVCSLFISFLVTKISEIWFGKISSIKHISVGAFCFLIVIYLWALENRDLWRIGIDQYKRRVSLKFD